LTVTLPTSPIIPKVLSLLRTPSAPIPQKGSMAR
jgi:hypothetical protein